jgi:vacuolar protein sorting-associated protein 33A
VQSAVYILRPELDQVVMLIDQIKLQGPSKEPHILFIPRRTIECDELLDKNGLLDDRIHHLNLDLLQLDEDLLSLELPTSFSDYVLGDDDTYKIYVQSSLQRLETLYGKIKYKYAKGSVSTKILQNL